MQDLEQELGLSASDAKKYEELHQQSGSHAESGQRSIRVSKIASFGSSECKRMGGIWEHVNGNRDMVADENVSQAFIEHDDVIEHAEEISTMAYMMTTPKILTRTTVCKLH
ncbi:hypothetical protein Tco_1236035 [Tanacetum coccineum]